MQGACEKKLLLSLLTRKNVATFLFSTFLTASAFEAGRQYALDVFQSRGEPAL